MKKIELGFLQNGRIFLGTTPIQMPLKPKPHKSPKKAISPRPVPGGIRLLIVIDNEPIRLKEVQKYEQAEKQLLEARADLVSFETSDLPAFQRWEAQVFGKTLTQIRELETTLQDKRHLLFEIKEEQLWSGCSAHVAYRRVMAKRERGPEADPDVPSEDEEEKEEESAQKAHLFGESDLPPGFDINAFDQTSKKEQKNFQAFYRALAEMFEEMTGTQAPRLEDVLEQERIKHQGVRRSLPRTAGEDRIKTLYRQLVRQLHPDGKKELSAREREFWHEVQEAYKARDLERMEAVAGRLEMGLSGQSSMLSIQTLRRMTQEIARQVQVLRQNLRSAQEHPAWKFARRLSQRTQYEKSRRQEFSKHQAKITLELKRVQDYLAALAVKGASAAPRRKTAKATKFSTKPASSFPKKTPPPFEDSLGLFKE